MNSRNFGCLHFRVTRKLQFSSTKKVPFLDLSKQKKYNKIIILYLYISSQLKNTLENKEIDLNQKQNMQTQKRIGIIKWYNNIQGFGIILTANNEQYFVHNSTIISKPEVIEMLTVFVFEPHTYKGKLSTKWCQTPSLEEGLLLPYSYLTQDRFIKMEIEVTNKGKFGNPYIKKEERSFDILLLYLITILNNKQSYLIEDYFKSFFLSEIVNSDLKDIIEYYKVTKSALKNLAVIENLSIIDNKLVEYEKSKDNLELNTSVNIKQLILDNIINFYNSQLSNFQKIKIWQAGEYGTNSENNSFLSDEDYGFNFLKKIKAVKKPSPIDENLLIEFINELSFREMKRICKYSLDKKTVQKLIEKLTFEKISTIEHLKKVVEIVNKFQLSEVYFDKIIQCIDDELCYDIWNSYEIYINKQLKKIGFDYITSDFEIQPKVFVKKADIIDKKVIEKISKTCENKNEIINAVLNEKINKLQINDNNLIDIIHSIKLADKESQPEILSTALPQISVYGWETLIENKLLTILPNSIGCLLDINFHISNNNSHILNDLISNSKKIEFVKRIEYLNNLSINYLISYTIQQITEIKDFQKLLILNISFDKNLLETVLLNWKFEDNNTTIKLLKLVNERNALYNSDFIKNLKLYIDKFSVSDLIEIYKYCSDDLFTISIIEKFSFSYYSIESDIKILNEIFILLPLTESQKYRIVSTFYQCSTDISIYNIIEILNLFTKNEINTDFKQIDFFKPSKIKNVEIDDYFDDRYDFEVGYIETLIDFHNNLLDEPFRKLEQVIDSYIIDDTSKKPSILLKIIDKSNSSTLISSAIQEYSNSYMQKEYFKILKRNSNVSKIDRKIIYESIKDYVNHYPIEVLDISLLYIDEYYDTLTHKVALTDKVMVDFYNLLEQNEDKIKKLIASESDLNTLALFHFRFTEEIYAGKINKLFEKYNYNYQSIFLKFYCYYFKNSKINKIQFHSIIDSIQFIELNALMIKSFIKQKANNRDELMNLMNGVLKAHFKHLVDKKLGDIEFKNIFSIQDLVKECDGRKKYSGLKMWQGGGVSRIYTNYTPSKDVGEREHMFCEGRFWKSQQFYYSGSNRPTEESYDFYWCKNDVCVGINDVVDFELPFNKWTLSEINKLFSINLDRLAFVHLAGWLNRMQSIFDRLKCRECKNILRPKAYTPQILGHYAVPLFNCVNEDCGCYNKEIRFTHCRGCNKILESRECTSCNKCGWLICNDNKCNKCGCGSNYQPVYAEYK